jgi:hypothetical protein
MWRGLWSALAWLLGYAIEDDSRTSSLIRLVKTLLWCVVIVLVLLTVLALARARLTQ